MKFSMIKKLNINCKFVYAIALVILTSCAIRDIDAPKLGATFYTDIWANIQENGVRKREDEDAFYLYLEKTKDGILYVPNPKLHGKLIKESKDTRQVNAYLKIDTVFSANIKDHERLMAVQIAMMNN